MKPAVTVLNRDMHDYRHLGTFLQSRRARITPASVGLPPHSRRRVPGLRREELAQLAGISVEYYQRLEQGRASNPSEEVLTAISNALRLDAVEQDHLRVLVRRPRPNTAASEVRPELTRLVNHMTVPAMVIDDLFMVLAANPLASRLFEASGRNLARYLFLDPDARGFYIDWDEVATATAAQLRVTAARYPEDDGLVVLLDELADSTEFRKLWMRGDVEVRTHGVKSFRVPDVGVLTFTYENLEVAGAFRQRLVAFTPHQGSATEAAMELLGTESLGLQRKP
ncbi:helix-turn-helix domain-containing protein [Nonomuraea phyllanthi]|uniref:helix-turn-helix domain-containing protein n=1 Tax=Nonomuraea phyllanthi TaxID=2219224 RepID=UPI001D147C91|nr:helix-turn-helix transcriptional regulator [Nonomuraea phyllanthi]